MKAQKSKEFAALLAEAPKWHAYLVPYEIDSSKRKEAKCRSNRRCDSWYCFRISRLCRVCLTICSAGGRNSWNCKMSGHCAPTGVHATTVICRGGPWLHAPHVDRMTCWNRNSVSLQCQSRHEPSLKCYIFIWKAFHSLVNVISLTVFWRGGVWRISPLNGRV